MKVKEERDLTKERRERCEPLAASALRLIVEGRPLVGDQPDADFRKSYEPIVKSILELYLKAKLPIGDVDHVKALALQAFDWTFNLVTESLNESLRKSQIVKFGKEVKDVTVDDLHKLLGGE